MKPDITIEDLKALLLKERLSSYVRLSGGFPIPLAGAVYWMVLGISGFYLNLANWAMMAFISSGLIFPLALIFAKIFNNPFMKDKSAVDSVLPPTFISMLLFWAILIPAIKIAPELTPLILAIGMSGHWPVIGWSYGRSALFSAHSIIRAIAVMFVWFTFPEHSLTLLPFMVASIYLLTVIIILIDVKNLRKRASTKLFQEN